MRGGSNPPPSVPGAVDVEHGFDGGLSSSSRPAAVRRMRGPEPTTLAKGTAPSWPRPAVQQQNTATGAYEPISIGHRQAG